MAVWQYSNGHGTTIIVVLEGRQVASAREAEFAYFEAEASQWAEVYIMRGYALDGSPALEELPIADGRVSELASVYEPPNS